MTDKPNKAKNTSSYRLTHLSSLLRQGIPIQLFSVQNKNKHYYLITLSQLSIISL